MINAQRQQGVVLPLTLIILAVLTAMASIVILRSDSSIENAMHQKDQWQARLHIHNAEQRLFYAMYAGEQRPGSFQVGHTLLLTDSTPAQLSNDVWVAMQDLDGLIGLTFLTKTRVNEVMRQYTDPSQAQTLTRRIIEWQKQGGEADIREGVEPRFDLFRSLDELMLIPGIDADMYNGDWNIATQSNMPTSTTQTGQGPQFGLRDAFSIRARIRPNLMAMPPFLLKWLYNLTDEDLNRLARLKADANWRGVAESMRNMGLPYDSGNAYPGKRFMVRYQYNGIKARAKYEMLPFVFPPKRVTWYFPDQYRYFSNSNS